MHMLTCLPILWMIQVCGCTTVCLQVVYSVYDPKFMWRMGYTEFIFIDDSLDASRLRYSDCQLRLGNISLFQCLITITWTQKSIQILRGHYKRCKQICIERRIDKAYFWACYQVRAVLGLHNKVAILTKLGTRRYYVTIVVLCDKKCFCFTYSLGNTYQTGAHMY